MTPMRFLRADESRARIWRRLLPLRRLLLRLSRGVSREKIAKECGVSKGTLIRWLKRRLNTP